MRTSAIDPVYRERFRREGEMLAALNHAHIIPIYGMGEVDGELYIASRLVSTTLRSTIIAGQLPVDEAMKVLACVASALDAAHAIGVVHRDVKPANVLMDPGPEVFLGDFGLARDPEGARADRPGPGARHDRLHGSGAAGRRARGPRDRHLRTGLPGHRDADRYRPLSARH